MEVGTVERVDIEEKMRSAYLDYAMSVITARALPDVRDGLKPVQRRILYAMHDMGIRHGTPTRKSARIVGEVLGKYHPHGDTAVYDAMVRMAQDFSMRYPLVEGQGNFGSVDGDGAAAMRYTEARISAIGEELLEDLAKDTVDFAENFDGSLNEPTVLPAKLPNLLVNGVGGIAVGMATNVPPHNLGEIADAIAYLVDRYDKTDDVTVEQLMRFVPGPDFPTGGSVLGREGIRQAYATGKGRIIMRAHAHIEDLRGGRAALIVTELPFQVNKANLVERIATLVRDERVGGISDLRDESDRTGMRIVIELKRGVEPTPVLADLLRLTQLQATFGANMLALVNGEPKLLSLKRALLHYIDHRRQVLTRRTRFELERALARAHILEGLIKALDNLDEVIATIRRSRTADTARTNLRKKFGLSEFQAQAILDLQLRRLAALERRKIEEEYAEIKARIKYLRGLLSSKGEILELVKADALDLKKRFGDARRTRIVEESESDVSQPGDLVPDEHLFVLLTAKGRVRQRPLRRLSVRSGSIPGMASRESDVLQECFVANAQDTIAFFTDQGRAFGLPAHQLPGAAQQQQGLQVSRLVRLSPDERVVAMLHIGPATTPAAENEAEEDAAGAAPSYLCLGTTQGKVKRLALSELASLGRAPLQVIGLSGDGNGSSPDSLGWVVATSSQDEIVITTAEGKAIRFLEDTVRPQGRSAGGVRGISLASDDSVVGLDVVRPTEELLVATSLGYAKRSLLGEYSAQGRGGQGALTVDVTKTARTGPLVSAIVVSPEDEVVFVTSGGSMSRVPVSKVSRLRRASWGRLVSRTRRGATVAFSKGELASGEAVVSVVRLSMGASNGDPKPGTDDDPSGPKAPVSPRSRSTTKRRRRTTAKIKVETESEAAAKPSTARTRRARRKPEATAPKPRASTRRRASVPKKDAPAPASGKPRRSGRASPTQGASEGSGKGHDVSAEQGKPKRRTRRASVTKTPRRRRKTS